MNRFQGAFKVYSSSNLDFKSYLKLTQLEEIESAAMKIPSGDNCQPFKIEFQGDLIIVLYNNELGKHELNIKNIASMISLGSLIQSLEILLSENYKICLEEIGKIEFNEGKNGFYPVVTLKWKLDSKPEFKKLSPVILKRNTDRRPYGRMPFSKNLNDELLDLNKKYKYAQLHLYSTNKIRENKKILNFLQRSDEYLWMNKKALLDFLNWLRWDESHFKKTRDGMSMKNLLINPIVKLFLKIFYKNPKRVDLLWKFSFKNNINSITKKLVVNSGSIVGFSIKSEDVNEIVELGRLSFEAWLILTKHNCGAQPLTLATLLSFVYSSKNYNPQNHNLGKYNDYFQKNFLEGVSILQESFCINNTDRKILWALRAGYVNEPLPLQAQTLRR